MPVATLGGITSSRPGFAAAVGRSRHRHPSQRWRGQLVAWVGAVLNAHRPVDQRRFALMLWRGIVGIALTGVRHGKPHYWHGHSGLLGDCARLHLGKSASSNTGEETVVRWAARGFVLAGAGLAFSLLIGHPRGPGRLFPNLTWPSLALQSVGLDLAVVGGAIVGAAR